MEKKKIRKKKNPDDTVPLLTPSGSFSSCPRTNHWRNLTLKWPSEPLLLVGSLPVLQVPSSDTRDRDGATIYGDRMSTSDKTRG